MGVKGVGGDGNVGDCNSSCLRQYNAFTDIPWRVYCKKACTSDGDSWSECTEHCRDLCHKHPVYKGKHFEWTAALARSPGDIDQSRRCDKACIRGCAFKFHVAAKMLESSLPAKVISASSQQKQQQRHRTFDPSIFSDHPSLSSSA